MAKRVTVRCYGSLREHVPEEREVSLADRDGVPELVETLGLQKEQIGLILIDGRTGPPTSPLRDGETVSFFNPMCGG